MNQQFKQKEASKEKLGLKREQRKLSKKIKNSKWKDNSRTIGSVELEVYKSYDNTYTVVGNHGGGVVDLSDSHKTPKSARKWADKRLEKLVTDVSKSRYIHYD